MTNNESQIVAEALQLTQDAQDTGVDKLSTDSEWRDYYRTKWGLAYQALHDIEFMDLEIKQDAVAFRGAVEKRIEKYFSDIRSAVEISRRPQ